MSNGYDISKPLTTKSEEKECGLAMMKSQLISLRDRMDTLNESLRQAVESIDGPRPETPADPTPSVVGDGYIEQMQNLLNMLDMGLSHCDGQVTHIPITTW